MIRAARPEETGALVALGEATGIFAPGETDALLRGTLDALHAGELAGDHEVAVWAEPHDGAPTGWVYFGPQHTADAAWELFWIGVDPARHGQGIGDALLRFVEDRVVRAGGRVLVIETSSLPGLARARRFYTACGYALRGVEANHYGQGDDKLTFVKVLALPPEQTR